MGAYHLRKSQFHLPYFLVINCSNTNITVADERIYFTVIIGDKKSQVGPRNVHLLLMVLRLTVLLPVNLVPDTFAELMSIPCPGVTGLRIISLRHIDSSSTFPPSLWAHPPMFAGPHPYQRHRNFFTVTLSCISSQRFRISTFSRTP